MLFRRERAKIEDVWQVVGLRGTGSDTYTVKDLFVGDAHTLTRDRPEERREPGLLYRFSGMNIYASGFAAVALGIARATLDAFIDLACGKTPALTQTALRDSAMIQSAIGIADAKLHSARSWLIQVLRDTQEEVAIAGELNTAQRMRIRQAADLRDLPGEGGCGCRLSRGWGHTRSLTQTHSNDASATSTPSPSRSRGAARISRRSVSICLAANRAFAGYRTREPLRIDACGG